MILKIKNITGVITNSSSEVFIINTDSARDLCDKNEEYSDNFHIRVLTKEFLQEPGFYAKPILEVCGLIDKISHDQYAKMTYDYLEEDEWLEIYRKFEKEIDEKLLNVCCLLTIENHFPEYEHAYEDAKFTALWNEHNN